MLACPMELDAQLEKAEAFHGHICGGIVIGVRMALLGLAELGLSDPTGRDRHRLMVFVEIDRCATDAISSVTGCRPGKRSMKIKDYGKMAATFLDLESGRAVRIAAIAGPVPAVAGADPKADLAALKTLPIGDLFKLQAVTVPLGPGDLPGPPVASVPCAHCGESILDRREVLRPSGALCQPCAGAASYYAPMANQEQA